MKYLFEINTQYEYDYKDSKYSIFFSFVWIVCRVRCRKDDKCARRKSIEYFGHASEHLKKKTEFMLLTELHFEINCLNK